MKEFLYNKKKLLKPINKKIKDNKSLLKKKLKVKIN